MTDWTGRTLDRVTLRRLIGRGGMAEIYLAQDLSLGRLVAVKLLYGHLVADSASLKRFREEARAIASLRHPHIVQVYDFDVFEDRPYIVMEYIEGVSLAEVVQRTQTLGSGLPLPVILVLIDQLASALEYAHGKGIIHRDVKPSNIMLRNPSSEIASVSFSAEPNSVLTDFGIARIAGTTSQTASGAVLGTPAYMSPEQVRGQAVDARSDVYSLGCVAYELIAGRSPFASADDTMAAILFRQAFEAAPALPTAYAHLQPVLDRALAKEPSDRYLHAGAFVSDFGNNLHGDEIGHRDTLRLLSSSRPGPASPPARAEVQRRRSLGWTMLVVALSAIVVGALVSSGTGSGTVGATPTTASLAAIPASPTSAIDADAIQRTSSVTASPTSSPSVSPVVGSTAGSSSTPGPLPTPTRTPASTPLIPTPSLLPSLVPSLPLPLP
ncbi:MAG: protein kinase [Anaerolineales bacterium]